MNWATKRARAVVNSIWYTEDQEAAIAASLREVADEAVEIADACGRHRVAGLIRAKFPKEGE